MENLKTILVLALFLVTFTQQKQQFFYQQMPDGKFIIAATHNLAKDDKLFKHQLNKHFHQITVSKNLKHDFIDYDTYSRNNQQLNVNVSPDKNILLKLKNLCYGEQAGNISDQKDKLQAFKKGVCSPVIVVPGILATSLMIEIDCDKLKKNNYQIFTQCGWSTCSTLGIDRPDTQYLLWVGLQLTLKVTLGKKKCFGDLFGLIYNGITKSNDFGSRYSFPEGVKSTWFGNTDGSASHSKCGSNAIRDLSGQSVLTYLGSQCALKDYGRMLDMLQSMGYQHGLTLQALPYDFRYGILASPTPKLLPQIINNLYYTTGKKVVIVAHSLGTLHTLMDLAYFVPQAQKDMMVRHYIPITPPWFGTVSAIRNVLYGDASYFQDGMFAQGINKYAQMKFSTVSGSTYDLFLKDAFKIYRDQPWMKQILKRIQYEKQGRTKNITYGNNPNLQNGEQDYPLNWFPSKYQKCFDDFFKKNPYCQTGFIDFKQTPIFQIKGNKYYGIQQDITKLINDNLQPKMAQATISLWNQTKVQNKTLGTIPAPGVNTSMIFSTAYKTQIFYSYDNYAKQDTNLNLGQNSFFRANKTGYTPGDISVPSFSALLFVSKWIFDKSNGQHQVNVIQYCGNYTGKKQHYSTITCQCNRNPFKNQLDCTHPCIISDQYLIAFVMGILTNSMKGYKDQFIANAISLNNRQIQMRMERCYNLNSNSYLMPDRSYS